jgi:ABC-type spermidine/putrescine transport system permease subunit II
MENLGIFYDNLVYFTAIGNSLGPVGIFCGHLVYISPFWYFVPRKIWQLRREYEQKPRIANESRV